jgi:transformation/transcription domain-associated protein
VGLLKNALRPDVWPNADLKLICLDKILRTVEAPQPNISNVCMALELLSFLIGILVRIKDDEVAFYCYLCRLIPQRKDLILAWFKPLQRGIALCMSCPNTKVIRAVNSLLSRLMALFPTEPASSNNASKYEELDTLYTCVVKVVTDGLTNYEKSGSGSPSQLSGTLMILKAACTHNSNYIDRMIIPFMRVLQRMARDHITHTPSESSPGIFPSSR